ncbi:MAG TPA: heme-binding domain-containing protein [Cyclobacteriaceae bacterium]|nr:heme-binding domain-containing protein [Cyclobacteriaceae bacterium]
MAKKILIGLLVILLFIQVMQPTRNQSNKLSENDISKVYALPAGVHETLMKKCYDCHSNNTHYPWYTYIQPVGWWMASHIHEGKEHLNFSEFKTYTAKRASHKLEEVSEEIGEGHMPLESYLWLHPEAEVTTEELNAINGWIASLGIKVAE